MKALTLTQPWASLVAVGAKRIETRGWSTNYRGPLAIHAGKGLGPVGGKRGLVQACAYQPFAEALGYATADSLPRGAIVASCVLVDVVPTEELTHQGDGLDARELAFGDYTPGRYGWVLADVRPLDMPIPCKGALGLWTPTPEVAAMVWRHAQVRP